jgi:serine/threonine protein kinase
MDCLMSNPAPDPTGRSSSVRRNQSATPSGSSVRKILPDSSEELTTISKNSSSADSLNTTDDPPTVITNKAPRPSNGDVQLLDSLAGHKLGHFELIESVGVGGMAAVIKANDLDLGRIVALKILPPDMAFDPENVIRFKHEARAAAKLDHENIARVYFCGEDQGLHFIAFEFVEGETLRSLFENRGGLLPLSEALHYLIQIAAGLSHASSRGVVHRDIKPSNILITPEGKAKIVDMGLARNLDPQSVNGAVTQSGVTLGTFDYISPEQAIEPRSADCRSDIYSLGCTFYHVLTGMVPVPEGTAAKKLHSHQHVAPIDPRVLNPNIPDEMAAILNRMMAKNPEDRYQHPDHLLQHLFQLAEKLQLPISHLKRDGIRPHSTYLDSVLPNPPRISILWVATAVICLVLMAIVLTGGFSGADPDPINRPPLWSENSPTFKKSTELQQANHQNSIEAINGAKEPKQATTTNELITLLKQGCPKIQLTPGTVYDLTRLAHEQPNRLPTSSDSSPEALFTGRELVLKGDISNPAVIQLRYALPDEGKIGRSGSLSFRGTPEGPSTISLQGITFKFLADSFVEESSTQVGLSFRSVDRIEIEGCSFLSPKSRTSDPAAIAVIPRTNSSEVILQNCYFGPGGVGLRSLGQNRIKALECSFAPQQAIFQMLPPENVDWTTEQSASFVRIEHCSVFLTTGSVVEIEDAVPVHIQSGYNLFSAPEFIDERLPVVVRQLGQKATETRYEAKLGNRTASNGYQNLHAYEEGSIYSFKACEEAKIPITDNQARIIQFPWKRNNQPNWPDTNPYNDPSVARNAFEANPEKSQLRVNDKQRPLLGANAFLGIQYNALPLPKPKDDEQIVENQKIWDPTIPSTSPLPLGVYRTLTEAILNHQKGDTILVRFNGMRPVEHIDISKTETDITIKPHPNYKPILVPSDQTNKATLFNMEAGRIIFDGLQFVLTPKTKRSLVGMPRGGECIFQNCVITLEEEGPSLSVVALLDNKGDMMMPTSDMKSAPPKISFQNSFIRGRGRLLYVRSSRTFELDVKNSLAVLDGSFIEMEPSATDPVPSIPAQIRLHQLTTYLSGHLLHIQGNAKQMEGKNVGLVRTNVQATNSVFKTANYLTPLILLDRVETENQMREVFSWEGAKNNLYGYPSKYEILKIQPESTDGMMLKKYDRDEWLTFTSESANSFTSFKFSYLPPEVGKSFSRVGKIGFGVRPLFESLPALDEGSSYGASLAAIPNALDFDK